MYKNTSHYFCLFLCLFLSFSSCQNEVNEPDSSFQILPSPQKQDFLGSSQLKGSDLKSYFLEEGTKLPNFIGSYLKDIQATSNKNQAQILLEVDPSLDLKAEGYTLTIESKQIQIKGKDQAGLMYGLMTLNQIIEDAIDQNVKLPQSSIEDAPALAYRAIHLDIKHHREKLEYYYQLMDELAAYKINAIIAEVEDKLGYQRQATVASEDAISIEEWQKLSAYAQERNISISPLVQGLGHASFILKHEEYKHLRDDPDSDWAFNPLDPETYEVQFDLYRDAIDATPHGKYLHVGGDEVHTTGRGSGKSALELQLIWLNKVCQFAAEQGRTPIFWDDMPLKHAGVYRAMFNKNLTQKKVDSIWAENGHKLSEFLDQFPKNCIYMRWNYASPQALGNDKAMEWFTSNGLQVMGATAGQRRWVLMPQDGGNIDNIKSFAFSSIAKGLGGLLLTLWDDDSPHFELYKRGIMAFAEYTWAGDKKDRNSFLSSYRHRSYGPAFASEEYAFVDALEAPVRFWKNALLEEKDRNRLRNLEQVEQALVPLPDPLFKGEWSKTHQKKLEAAKQHKEKLEEITKTIEYLKANALRNTYRLEVYEQVSKLAATAPNLLLSLERLDDIEIKAANEKAIQELKAFPSTFEDLRKEMEAVYSKTRILEKPDSYILDQDHHVHLANQSTNFDWQFYVEMLMVEKLEQVFD